MECALPFESHYDRAFLWIIMQLEHSGAIRPGDDLVEITSGSGGASFAGMCLMFGYQAHVIVAPETIPERIKPMIDLGAKVYLSHPGGVPSAAQAMLTQMQWFGSGRNGYARVGGYATPDNPFFVYQSESHRVCFPNHSWLRHSVASFRDISSEVQRVIGRARQPVTDVISALGNWTTTTALAEQLAQWPNPPRLIGAEDLAHAPITALLHPELGIPPPGPHETPGTGSAGVNIRFADPSKLADSFAIASGDFIPLQARYNRGNLDIDQIGRSTALCRAVAERIGNDGDVIVYPSYDSWDRYGDRPPEVSLTDARRHYSRIIPWAGRSQRSVQDVTKLPHSLAEFARQHEAAGLAV